jgi:putative membrane protein
MVPGIYVEDGAGWAVYAVMAVILGFVNAILRPLLKLLTCPLIILTLGLFTLVINGLTLWFSARLANVVFDVGFYINGFWAALLGALIVSLVSIVLSTLIPDDQDEGEEWG